MVKQMRRAGKGREIGRSRRHSEHSWPLRQPRRRRDRAGARYRQGGESSPRATQIVSVIGILRRPAGPATRPFRPTAIDQHNGACYEGAMRKVVGRTRINGAAVAIAVEGEMPLLWFLREVVGLTGTKFGCGIAQCGACTVLLRGVPVRSCVVPVAAAINADVVTIEGLAGSARGARVKRAWIEENVPQCGYCQSGMQVEALALLERRRQPTSAEIDTALGGHICRCGTYLRIRRAIAAAAKEA